MLATSASKSALPSFFALSIALLAVGCTVRGDDGTGGDAGGSASDGSIDGSADQPDMGMDGGVLYPDGSVNACEPGCGPAELCGDANHGNGLDDDCDGTVDEECTCVSGESRPCFLGPPDRRNVGACADGIAYCNEFGLWAACGSGVFPSAETCNGADDDCNGITDDLEGCSSAVMCPGNETASPLSTHHFIGDRVYTGAARSWHWSIECPASVPGELCPRLASPNAENTDVYFTASGAYRARLTVTLEDGTEASCAWSVYVQGDGLRVELNWDTMTRGTDVDLHLHRWTRDGVDTDFFELDDDCYWRNCRPTYNYDWPGHGTSSLANCENAPHGGAEHHRMRGYCTNPRLDVDTNGTDGFCDPEQTDPNELDFCAPENINIDRPVIGMPYRIMVNYFKAYEFEGRTNASVNIYCGGALRGAFGLDPLVFLENGDEQGAANDNWYVADVVFFEGECGLDCTIYPIGVIEQGPPAPQNDSPAPFGPEWSCVYDPSSRTCTPR